jgi:hypothetical protein
MNNTEPTLDMIEDYNGHESNEKRKIIWMVILSGLLIGAIYSFISSNSSVNDELKVQTNIPKH